VKKDFPRSPGSEAPLFWFFLLVNAFFFLGDDGTAAEIFSSSSGGIEFTRSLPFLFRAPISRFFSGLGRRDHRNFPFFPIKLAAISSLHSSITRRNGQPFFFLFRAEGGPSGLSSWAEVRSPPSAQQHPRQGRGHRFFFFFLLFCRYGRRPCVGTDTIVDCLFPLGSGGVRTPPSAADTKRLPPRKERPISFLPFRHFGKEDKNPPLRPSRGRVPPSSSFFSAAGMDKAPLFSFSSTHLKPPGAKGSLLPPFSLRGARFWIYKRKSLPLG